MGVRQLLARKPLADLHGESSGLKRVIGPVGLTAVGIGAIIGSGIFVTTGEVAARHAGPGVILSYVVAGLACALAALCYAEFASMAPSAGSAYSYAYATLGELVAWVIGWDLVLEYAASGAVVASGWAGYLDQLLRSATGTGLDPRLMKDPFSTRGAAWLNLPAALIMLVVTAVLIRGVRQGTVTNAVMVAVKVGVVVFVIVAGIQYVDPGNWTSIPPEARPQASHSADTWGLLGTLGVREWLAPADEATRSPFLPFGLSGVMLGSSLVFFAYLGFDTVSTHAEEARRPRRDLPLGILASLVVCTLLYIGVSAVLTGMEPYPDIDLDASVATAFARKGGSFARLSTGVIALGALAGMTSVLLVTFQGQARIFLAMARDGLLPARVFGAVHPRYRTPYRSTALTGSLVAVVAALTPAEDLGNMVCIGTLMAFGIVCAAVLVLRVTRPDAERPFRCPAVWVVAPLGILVNGVMMLFLPPATWVRLVVWLVVGLVIYFAYGFRHSRLRPAAAA
jgi:basic amino acid/polyamine antiporter, APA family